MRRVLTRTAIAALVLSGCILPDRGIIIVDENVQNKHPVRFVEPTPISPEALDACLSLDEVRPEELCQPGEAATVLPHFLDPKIAAYDFCSCDVDTERDQTPLTVTTLYVEDGGSMDNATVSVHQTSEEAVALHAEATGSSGGVAVNATTRRAMRSIKRALFAVGLSISSGRRRRTVSQTASSCSMYPM